MRSLLFDESPDLHRYEQLAVVELVISLGVALVVDLEKLDVVLRLFDHLLDCGPVIGCVFVECQP